MTHAEVPLTLLEEPAPRPVAAPWSLAHRILFRIVCSYFVLYSFHEDIPGAGLLSDPYYAFWHKTCPWVGSHAFHMTGKALTYFPTSSGDTSMDYVQNLMFVLCAFAAALIWSVLDRKR